MLQYDCDFVTKSQSYCKNDKDNDFLTSCNFAYPLDPPLLRQNDKNQALLSTQLEQRVQQHYSLDAFST